ncbi:MAG: alcohol dehydrogenase catalytic domain-containing protein [Candidatus Korobacteraceae bacterium]|jgi:threonine dehydrogenase-like Zn-dependent dehydrogenase
MNNKSIPKTMRAAVLQAKGQLCVQDWPVPEPGPFEVLIKVMACAICGSDPTVVYKGWQALPPYGTFVPGHEYSGQIVATGPNVLNFKVGDRVAIETHHGCGYCKNCKQGRYTICMNYGKTETGHRHYGFTTNGGYAGYVVNHISTLYKIPDNISFEEASLVTTAACVHFALDNVGGLLGGETVAVLGAGPIGLMAVQLVKALGAKKVILCGKRDSRLRAGKEVGADVVVDVDQEDPVKVVMAETDGVGADLVVECSGGNTAVQQSIDMAMRGGRLSLIGDSHEPMTVDMRKFVLSDMRAAGVRGEGMGDCARSLALFGAGKIRAKPLITHHFPLEQIGEAFDTFIHRRGGAIKVIVHPNQE